MTVQLGDVLLGFGGASAGKMIVQASTGRRLHDSLQGTIQAMEQAQPPNQYFQVVRQLYLQHKIDSARPLRSQGCNCDENTCEPLR